MKPGDVAWNRFRYPQLGYGAGTPAPTAQDRGPTSPRNWGRFCWGLRSLAYTASTGARNHFPGTTKTSWN